MNAREFLKSKRINDYSVFTINQGEENEREISISELMEEFANLNSVSDLDISKAATTRYFINYTDKHEAELKAEGFEEGVKYLRSKLNGND